MTPAFLKLDSWITGFAVLVIAFFLLGGCVPANHPPAITSLKAEREVVVPSGSCHLECVASDEDGDELSYEWSASDGYIHGEGPLALWITPASEGIHNITVRVTHGKGGEVTDSITITLRVNHPPSIASLVASADWVRPSGSCQVKCDAEDSDGDELSYAWSASGGDISGTGAVVAWTAPDAVGLHNLAVVVTDGYGGEDRRWLTISVALNPPPIIEDLVITPEDPKYTKEYQGGYRILKGKSCEIECIASDPENGELSYEWTTDGGSISGEGPVVTWTAPQEGGQVIVTVTVSADGGVAGASMVFRVETCASCAFG